MLPVVATSKSSKQDKQVLRFRPRSARLEQAQKDEGALPFQEAAMSRIATTFRRLRSRRAWNLEMLEGRALMSTLAVLNNADHGSGSLRDAISLASPGDVINFNPNLSGQSIVVTGELQIDKNLDIEGLGAANLTISSQSGRVFDVVDGSTSVTIAGLTIADGVSPAGWRTLQRRSHGVSQ